MNNATKRQIKNLEKINELLDEGYSIRKACKKIGICMQTYYNIVNKYGKNLEDLDRKLNSHKNLKDDFAPKENDVELFKSDGTPLKEKSVKKYLPKDPLKRKPVDQCTKKDIDDELGYFFNKIH